MGLTSLIGCNFLGDVYRITRQDSPVAAVLDLDTGFQIDLDEREDAALEPVEAEKDS